MRALFIIPVVIATLLFFSVKFGSAGIISPVKIDVQERIAYHAEQKGLPFALVKAIAKVESNFTLSAKNPLDPSYGLMQITPMLAQDFGFVKDWRNVSAFEVSQIYNIDNNLIIGCGFLKHLSQYPFSQMVQSYNVGEWGYKTGTRNRDYLDKVKRYYDEYTT